MERRYLYAERGAILGVLVKDWINFLYIISINLTIKLSYINGIFRKWDWIVWELVN